MTFPVLESLTLVKKWSNLQFIAAPKLRNLVLISKYPRESGEETMSTLRRTTVRPMSLSTDCISDIYLPKLLELWPNLSELHLRRSASVCIPGPITTAALAGSGNTAPLCPSLRYLTVHMEQGRKNLRFANRSIQRLKKIVKKRQGHGIVALQRVMCVWNWRDHNKWSSSEVEWVDVL